MTETKKPPDDIIETDLPPHGLGARLRNYFLTGLVVAGPLAITAWLISAFVTWVDDAVRPLVPDMYRPETYLPWKIPGSGLVIALFALTLLGFLTANLVGRTLVQLGDHLIDRMPIVRPIYKTVKQVFQMLFSKSGTSFRKVGLVEFPAPGMWSLVFISQPPSADVASRLPGGDDQISVFLPCTPNPTTGFYFYVPRKKIIELDIPVEQAATLIMSAGMIQPGVPAPNGQPGSVAAMAAAAAIAQTARENATKEPAA
ncbi:DUF502 domain-containing protein [Pseudorhodoplanes sp.]|uniref:DUF502 domain-containing protein n=1 Tax=Pseudorhodoplanes sp. TaxID=1934341 RepID=UPI003D10334B